MKWYIGNDLPSEYTGSKYTYKLKGTVAKAKANAAQGIPELLETAQGGSYRENHKKRNEQLAWIIKSYTTQNPFLVYIIHHKNNICKKNKKSGFCLSNSCVRIGMRKYDE